MATFEISGSDGTVYEVEADSIEAAARAVGALGSKEKSWGQVLKENLFGDDDPNSQNWGEYIGSALNKAGESATFGLIGDETSAAAESILPGVNYDDRRDHYRQQERVLERDNPGTALGADVGGAVLGAMLPFGTIGTLGKGAGLGTRMAASGVAGAGMGGTYGFMEGEGLDERMAGAGAGATLGGIAGSAAPAIGSGAQKVADSYARRGAIAAAARGAPTTEALRAQGRAAYQAIDDAGVRVRPDRVRSAMDDIAAQLRGEGAGYTGAEKVLPASRSIMDATQDVGAKSNTVPFNELDMFRRYMGNAAASNPANRADTRAATEAMGKMDDFISALGPDDIDAGDVRALQEMLPKARDLWARMSRSQTIDDAISASEDYLSGQASGLRNQFKRIINSPALSRGFSDAEKKVMRRVINGSISERALNLLGGGMGQLMQVGAGIGLGGLPGAMIGMATGAGFRKASEAVARKNAEIARAIIANGGMPQLPVASDSVRQIVEALTRRTGAAAPQ